MVKTWPAKDPDEQLDYSYDWAEDLEDGETIDPLGSSFVPLAAAGTAIVDGPNYGPDFVTVIIGGGVAGEDASFTVRVATTANRILEDTVVLPIRVAVVPVPYPGAYADPTPANLVCLFPELATVPEPTIAAYLARAARMVDTSWKPGDFGDARMYLAAHLMTIAGLGSTAEAAAVNDGSGQFRSMAIGSLRLERFDKGKLASTFASTRYGAEFKRLLRLNRGGPRTTGPVPSFGGDGDKAWY